MTVPISAAFEGFRIIRQKPALVLFWGAFLLLGNALAFGVMAYLGGSAFTALLAAGETLEEDPQLVMSIMSDLAGPYLLMIVILLVFQSVLNCAIFRAVQNAPENSYGYLRLGKDEGRLILVSLLFFLLVMVINIGASLVGMIIGTPLGLLVGAGYGKAISELIGLAIYVYFLIRLSMCFVQSYDERKINLFGSWALTKGHVLNLTTVYLVAGLMVILVGLLCIVIFALIAGLALGGDYAVLRSLSESSTPEQVMAALTTLTPVLILYLLFASVIMAPLLSAIGTGTPAAAYKVLRKTDRAA